MSSIPDVYEFPKDEIFVVYWQHYCRYAETVEDIEEAMDFVKGGHDSGDMAVEGIAIKGEVIKTSEYYINNTWDELEKELRKRSETP